VFEFLYPIFKKRNAKKNRVTVITYLEFKPMFTAKSDYFEPKLEYGFQKFYLWARNTKIVIKLAVGMRIMLLCSGNVYYITIRFKQGFTLEVVYEKKY